ncbi:MAG: FAD-binding oxidoreductase [Gammaproteobacteria bacterium]
MGQDSAIPQAGIEALSSEVAGHVLLPDSTGYDAARAVWNGRFDYRPAVVIRCSRAADVVRAVNFARQHRLPLSVKGGGHDYAGNTVGEDSLLVDLSPMKAVVVDAQNRRATAEGGATWADVDAATQAEGLATPGGTVSTVGIAGFTLGGGAGWLTRKFGLAADNLLAAEVVTATGEVVRASSHDNPELFWALRGGSGNFGIVTRFEYRLHPVGPEILAGQVLYPVERAGELLRWYRDFMKTAPDELGVYAFFLRIPPLPDFPETLHGKVVLDFVVAYAGPPEEAEPHLAPFRQQGTPLVDSVGPVPYTGLQQAFDDAMGKGNRWYSRYLQLNEVSDEFIDTLVNHLEPFPGPFTTVYMGGQGGAPSRIAPEATAYPHRHVADALHIFPGWADPAEDEAIMGWARELYGRLAPFAEGGCYVNMLAEDELERLPAAYRGNYAKLAQVKKRWDPDNLFRNNRIIRPAD